MTDTVTGARHFTGHLLQVGDDDYEVNRREAIWNARRPDRYPDLILRAADAADVQAGVALAKEHGYRVGIRSGGHSWIANGIRHGGLTIDLSALNAIEYDPSTGIVAAGPAARSVDIDAAMARVNRFFPAGHAPSVGVGGFLLGGGYGWNARVHGPACLSIVGIDVVTADGRLLHADQKTEPDLFWSARGSGPGFCGVVTRFFLRTYDRPEIHRSVARFPLDSLDEVVRWTQDVAPWLPAPLEIAVKIGAPPGETAPVISVIATAFSQDGVSGEPLLELARHPSFADSATSVAPAWSLTVAQMYEESGRWSEQGLRWALDGIWTEGPTDRVAEGVRAMTARIPSSSSFVYILPWGQFPADPNAAWSIQAANYVSPVAAWSDPAADDMHRHWVTETTRAMEDVEVGVQFSDADPASRSGHGLSAAARDRLRVVRQRYDPEHLFNSYLRAEDL